MQANLPRIDTYLDNPKLPCWESNQQLLYKTWKEAWDNGYYRGGGEPSKPIGLDRGGERRWEDHAKRIYQNVTSKPQEWKRYRQEYEKRSRNDPACIAAERAMAGHSTQSSSEIGRSDSSARKRRDAGVNGSNSPGASTLLSSRRYRPGQGLLNKTLRASTPTRIPGPLHSRGQQTETDAAHYASLSPEDTSSETYGALPSSYRKLRKARSTLAPRHGGPRGGQGSWLTPRGTNRSLRSVTSSAVLQTSNLRLRLKRSLPFLRPKSITNTRNHADCEWGMREEAVQLARAQFLDHMELHRIQERRSAQHKRSSEGDDRPEDATASPHRAPTILVPPPSPADLPKAQQTLFRKRSLSASLRSQFRKMLGKSVPGKSVPGKDGIPPQQVDARGSPFPDLDLDIGHSSAFDSYLIPDISQTVQARACSSTEIEQELLESLDQVSDTLPAAVSRESLHSNTRSRVTSWTDSSITGSIGLRSGPIDRNRLSVIKEDGGPHQPSSSAGRHIGGVEVFREPLQTVSNDGQLLPPVDSHRVYSALIKRIGQEEAEIETTRIALENINNKSGAHSSMAGRATIRTVCSESSLSTAATAAPDEQPREFSIGSHTWHCSEDEPGAHQDDYGSGKRHERLKIEDSQSSFFPSSCEQNPAAPSPFRRFLSERRRQKSSSDCTRYSEDTGTVIVNHNSGHSILRRPRFGFSSESVYSRTTNGGINEQYIPPLASSDDLGSGHQRDRGDPGIISVISRGHVRSNSDNSPEIDPSSLVLQNSRWNPWSETLTAMTAGAQGRNTSHVSRQMEGSTEEISNQIRQSSTASNYRTPTHGLRAIASSSTPSTGPTISVQKRRKEVVKTSSCGVLNSISNKTGVDAKADAYQRRSSPGRFRRLLHEKKSQFSIVQDHGKENIPTDEEMSLLNSGPEKPHKAFGARNTSARLRKRASKMVLISHKDAYATPPCGQRPTPNTPTRFDGSPSERAKNQLVARLSRPFNMDVPPHNRPFDSTYLGKRTPGHPDPMGNSRLSVARPIPESVEELPCRNTDGRLGDEATATQPASFGVVRGTSKVLGIFGSRRMVSSFLKSRMGSKATSEDGLSAVEGSPAFI
ncbi:hypothetical protein PV08_09745 [Exophiala spinifera]|uniref:Uncharacterized protein n=1 Tax=Exophiala spinifera TaxID=91928 RepID=A0A0D2B0M4_9EURO|nr:uncharacterized protein PV08_09745 [Exophiala spinifera]KIW12468.1 hypothetical protein PV08_09745 [Exophiala spinifera]